MSTTQHPLTDEQAFNLAYEHPLIPDFARAAFDAGREHERTAAQARSAEVTTEAIRREVEYAVRTAAAHGYAKGKWGADRSEPIQALIKSAGAALTAALTVAAPADPHHDPRPWQECTRADIRKGDLMEAKVRGSVRISVAHHQNKNGDWRSEGGWLLTYGDRWPLRRTPAHTTEKETPMTETTTPATAEPLARTLLGVPEGYGAPHHDAGRIKPGDFVAQVDEDGYVRASRVHHQDEDGDWRSESGMLITCSVHALRPDAITVWPAPTPPAAEVGMPTEHPAHLLDVEGMDGAVCAYMVLGRDGRWNGVTKEGVIRYWGPGYLAFFTLPDGTRARRDGEYASGTPRFVKVQEAEK